MKMSEGSQKRVENTVGNGEIARHEQFLPFPQYFQKKSTEDTQNPGLVWERVKMFSGLLLKLSVIATRLSSRESA